MGGKIFNNSKKKTGPGFGLSFFIIALFLLLGVLAPLVYSLAIHSDELLWGGREEEVQFLTGLGDRDPILIVAGLIRVVLGFLGILILTIIILAGFRWMLSGGSVEKADEAKRMLFSGIVGLIIILASFALVDYLLGVFSDVI